MVKIAANISHQRNLERGFENELDFRRCEEFTRYKSDRERKEGKVFKEKHSLHVKVKNVGCFLWTMENP